MSPLRLFGDPGSGAVSGWSCDDVTPADACWSPHKDFNTEAENQTITGDQRVWSFYCGINTLAWAVSRTRPNIKNDKLSSSDNLLYLIWTAVTNKQWKTDCSTKLVPTVSSTADQKKKKNTQWGCLESTEWLILGPVPWWTSKMQIIAQISPPLPLNQLGELQYFYSPAL